MFLFCRYSDLSIHVIIMVLVALQGSKIPFLKKYHPLETRGFIIRHDIENIKQSKVQSLKKQHFSCQSTSCFASDGPLVAPLFTPLRGRARRRSSNLVHSAPKS